MGGGSAKRLARSNNFLFCSGLVASCGGAFEGVCCLAACCSVGGGDVDDDGGRTIGVTNSTLLRFLS